MEAIQPRSEYDEGLLAYALRMAADVRFLAGDYERSAELFAALAQRLRDRPKLEAERAAALAGAARAYAVLSTSYPNNEPDRDARAQMARRRAQQALREMYAELPKLEPTIRKEFEDYLKTFDPSLR